MAKSDSSTQSESTRGDSTITEQQQRQQGSSCLCGITRCCCWGIASSLFVVAAVVALSIVFTGSPNPADYFIPVDPPGQLEAIRWNAEAGLTLVVENAMDDSYIELFDQSIIDWNESPALFLQPTRVEVDPDCNVWQGRLRICNDDYGDTPWRGLNVAVLDSNELIIYSTAKINDRHMDSVHQKVYTICHELGHGFGLPHTDENHFNRDRGDCMDYTERPWNNDVPGAFNLNLLVDLYGTPDLPLSARTSPPTTASQGDEPGQVPSPGDNNNNNNQGGTSGGLRGREPPANDARDDHPFSFGRDKEEDEEEDEDDRNLLDAGALKQLTELVDQEVAKCQTEHCSYEIEGGYRVEVSMVLV